MEFADLYPTLAELCGLKSPSGLAGQSMMKLLNHPSQTFKKAAFTQIKFKDIVGRSVRSDR